jgi:hypothetical protein
MESMPRERKMETRKVGNLKGRMSESMLSLASHLGAYNVILRQFAVKQEPR